MNKEQMLSLWEEAAKIMEANKTNPWAVCHASTGKEKSKKFERCVKDVKKSSGYEEEPKTS